HRAAERGVAAARLGVHEPAVEAVRPCHLDELRGQRIVPGGILLHEVAGPPELTAVGGGRQEDVAQYGYAVPVGRVHDRRVRRQDEPLTGRAAPEDQFVEVRPVGEGVVVGGRRSLGRVAGGRPEGHQGLDARLVRAGGGVGRGRREAGGERHGGGVEG